MRFDEFTDRETFLFICSILTGLIQAVVLLIVSKKEREKETVIHLDESTHIIKVFTESWTIARSLKKAGFQPVRKNGGWLVEIPQSELSKGDWEGAI